MLDFLSGDLRMASLGCSCLSPSFRSQDLWEAGATSQVPAPPGESALDKRRGT